MKSQKRAMWEYCNKMAQIFLARLKTLVKRITNSKRQKIQAEQSEQALASWPVTKS